LQSDVSAAGSWGASSHLLLLLLLLLLAAEPEVSSADIAAL
jgi:hypothetical protein